MSDIAGRADKQTEECRRMSAKERDGIWAGCPNIKERDDRSLEAETYDCKTCGARYRLYYEDMA